MLSDLVYLGLELKRALKRLPQILAGAVALLFLMGAIAFLSARTLYGDAALGRIAVGVVLPEDGALAKKAVDMIASLDSVKSICDFTYLDKEAGLEKLESGELYAVMEIPEGMIRGIMDGTNTPVHVFLAADAGLEGQIFRELADAGATILSASQAGIYAADDLCRIYGIESSIGQVEADLNRIYLSYSLPRSDYFRHRTVSATGDVDTARFYGISAYVLFLLLCAIPVSGYLIPMRISFSRKLSLEGIGAPVRTGARILGLAVLFAAASVPAAVLAAAGGAFAAGGLSAAGLSAGGSLTDIFLRLAVLAAVCLAAASFAALLYQLAGTLLGGVMLLFLAAAGQHFLAGGFLPPVFLPEAVRRLAPFLPSAILMDGVRAAVTAAWDPSVFARLTVLILAGWILSTLWEVKQQWEN